MATNNRRKNHSSKGRRLGAAPADTRHSGNNSVGEISARELPAKKYVNRE